MKAACIPWLLTPLHYGFVIFLHYHIALSHAPLKLFVILWEQSREIFLHQESYLQTFWSCKLTQRLWKLRCHRLLQRIGHSSPYYMENLPVLLKPQGEKNKALGRRKESKNTCMFLKIYFCCCFWCVCIYRYTCTCMKLPMQSRRGHQITWGWTYRWLWAPLSFPRPPMYCVCNIRERYNF